MITADDREAAETLLDQVGLFRGLGHRERSQLAERAVWVELKVGSWLFRAGQAADALYLLGSGRLEVTAPEDDGQPIREIGPGEAVGELGILTGAPRSASVRARRDCLLLRVARGDFEQLLREPSFTAALLRALGERLRESRALPAAEAKPAAVIAVASLGTSISANELAEGVGSGLEAWSPVTILDQEAAGGDRATYAARLDSHERKGERVLLVLGDVLSPGPWDSFALEHADRTLLASDCAGTPPEATRLRGCDLVICGPGSGAASWLAELEPRATHRVRSMQETVRREDLGRVSRRLAGRALGVVLSGGGARGLAHIGALAVLKEGGVRIDRIAGCSMGAIVGALFASGLAPAEVSDICREELVRRNPLNDYTLPLAALSRGVKAKAMLNRMFGDGAIEELPLSYLCVSTDMVSGRLAVHRHGPLVEAVGASACLPGLLPPVSSGERLLVDGGVLNNLPVAELAAAGEGPLIAVDVTARYERSRTARRRPRSRALEGLVRRVITGESADLPKLAETLNRMVTLGSVDTTEEARAHADVVIEPRVQGLGITAFADAARIIEAGRSAASEHLDEVRTLSR